MKLPKLPKLPKLHLDRFKINHNIHQKGSLWIAAETSSHTKVIHVDDEVYISHKQWNSITPLQ